MIGNAFPPLLAERFGVKLFDNLMHANEQTVVPGLRSFAVATNGNPSPALSRIIQTVKFRYHSPGADQPNLL